MDPSVRCHQQPVRSYSPFAHKCPAIHALFGGPPYHRAHVRKKSKKAGKERGVHSPGASLPVSGESGSVVTPGNPLDREGSAICCCSSRRIASFWACWNSCTVRVPPSSGFAGGLSDLNQPVTVSFTPRAARL